MSGRALVAGIVLVLASPASVRADGCPASTLDIADWPIVRSARVPGFTLRLPRSFTRDSAGSSRGSAPSARWSDAARGHLTLSHVDANATPAPPPLHDSATLVRCDASIGAATATIVTYADGPSAWVVHAHIRWPDGEVVEVRADAASRAHVELLVAAVRTIRRVGA